MSGAELGALSASITAVITAVLTALKLVQHIKLPVPKAHPAAVVPPVKVQIPSSSKDL